MLKKRFLNLQIQISNPKTKTEFQISKVKTKTEFQKSKPKLKTKTQIQNSKRKMKSRVRICVYESINIFLASDFFICFRTAVYMIFKI